MTWTRAQLERAARSDLADLRSPEGWLQAGLPRFARLFGRDSCISALQMLPEDPTIAATTVRALADLQGRVENRRREEEPGKILHEHPVRLADRIRRDVHKRFRWGWPYYGGVDSTSWFVRVVDRYVEATGDRAIVDELHDNLVRAAQWMAGPARIGAFDLVGYVRRNPAALEHQGWRDSDLGTVPITPPVALVELQGYHAEAAAALDRLGIDARGVDVDRVLFERAFSMPADGFYGLAVGGDGTLVDIVTSNPGHLLATPILDIDDASRLADRLFGDDLWTVGGIRTHSCEDRFFDGDSYHRGSVWPHDNWLIHEGLVAIGRSDDAARVREAVLDACCALEQIPELYAVDSTGPRSLRIAQTRQAWSCGAVLSFLAAERTS